jgi:hypothetical protein
LVLQAKGKPLSKQVIDYSNLSATEENTSSVGCSKINVYRNIRCVEVTSSGKIGSQAKLHTNYFQDTEESKLLYHCLGNLASMFEKEYKPESAIVLFMEVDAHSMFQHVPF